MLDMLNVYGPTAVAIIIGSVFGYIRGGVR